MADILPPSAPSAQPPHPTKPPRTRLITLVRREDGREGSTFDVGSMSPRDLDRLWDALVMKVDFEVWGPTYTPERGDDESLDEWLTGGAA